MLIYDQVTLLDYILGCSLIKAVYPSILKMKNNTDISHRVFKKSHGHLCCKITMDPMTQ